MPSRKVFNVVVALKTQSYAGQRKLTGIFRFLSEKHLWDITLLRSSDEFHVDFIDRTKENTDGFILSLHESKEVRNALVKTGKPIVFLDDVDLGAVSAADNVSFLKTDQIAVGRTAAAFLHRRTHFAVYAFVHALGCPHWSLGREKGFTEALNQWNKPSVVYRSAESVPDAADLAAWIKSLPRPAAIFAAFDDRAIDVLNACRRCGLKIPEDVMILGAGDDEPVCNSYRPALSSIRIPFEEYGYLAARELQAKMLTSVGRQRIIHAPGRFLITARQTTTGAETVDSLAQDALAYIASHATQGIKVPDVVNHLKVSRRLADLRFRQTTGKSILEVITEYQINEAKRLLEDRHQSIDGIAVRCGFSSANYFKNVFSRKVGTSPSKWRKKNLPV